MKDNPTYGYVSRGRRISNLKFDYQDPVGKSIPVCDNACYAIVQPTKQ